MGKKRIILELTEEQHKAFKEQAKIEGLTIKTFIMKHCGFLNQ